MASDIKQRIVLEGEKEYNSALKEAQRNLKVLRSELKAETAELGKNASEQEKNQAKLKNLQKQISEQEKVVKTYEKALEEVREKYSDNGEAIAKWEIKLNDARAALANMQNDLNGLGNSYKNIESGAELSVIANKSLADSFASIASMGETVSSSIESVFSSVKDSVMAAAQFVFGEITNLAARANNLGDLAGYWNTDAANVQKWQAAVKASANSIEDLNQVVQKINLGDDKKIAELVGVSSQNYADKWNYAMAVMDAMSKMDYEARENAAKQIFGSKGTTKAYDLLNEWNKIQSKLSRFDAENGGLGMNNEMIDTFDQISVNLATLQTTWEEFKQQFEAGALGKLTLNLTSNAQGILDSFIAFMGADNEQDRNAAIDQLEENMTAFFTNIGEAIQAAAETLDKVGGELAGNENGYVAMIGKALQSLSDVLEWFTDPNNWKTVETAFETLIGIWAGGKIADALGNMAKFIGNIGTIKKFFSGGGSKAAAELSSGSNANWVTALLTKVFPVVAGAGIVVADSLNNHGSNDISSSEFLDMAKNGDEYAKSVTDALYERYKLSISDLKKYGRIDQVLSEGWKTDEELFSRLENKYGWKTDESLVFTDAMREAAETFWDAWRDDGDFTEKELAAYESAFEGYPDLLEKMDRLFTQLTDEFSYGDEGWTNMTDLPSEWWTNQNSLTSEDISGFRVLPNNIAAAVRNGVSNIRVTMDGQTVGRLIAPIVSEQIARDMVV